jgi:hypothetical protein
MAHGQRLSTRVLEGGETVQECRANLSHRTLSVKRHVLQQQLQAKRVGQAPTVSASSVVSLGLTKVLVQATLGPCEGTVLRELPLSKLFHFGI